MNDRTIMDEVDRVASRMSLAAMLGLFGGAAVATYRGSPLYKTSVSMAMSCALVATACFGFERLSHVALQQQVLDTTTNTNNNNDSSSKDSAESSDQQRRLLYGSHVLGGAIGGGIAGFLFQRRPISGTLLCTPIMVGVAFAEQKLEEERRERLRQLMADKKEKEEEKSQSVSTNDTSNRQSGLVGQERTG